MTHDWMDQQRIGKNEIRSYVQGYVRTMINAAKEDRKVLGDTEVLDQLIGFTENFLDSEIMQCEKPEWLVDALQELNKIVIPKDEREQTKRLSDAEDIVVSADGVDFKIDGATFYFSVDQIQEHLLENWMETESCLIVSEGVTLEMYNADYRALRRSLYPFGK